MVFPTLGSLCYKQGAWCSLLTVIHFCICRYSLVSERNSSALQTYVQEGDNRNARLHTQIVANRLNRLGRDPADPGVRGHGEAQRLREKIRRAMLWSLKDLPIRDQVSGVTCSINMVFPTTL